MELAVLRVQPALRELRAAAAAPQHARRQAQLRFQVETLTSHRHGSCFILYIFFYLVTSTYLCECPVSDPEAAAEEEAGSGLGRGDDRDGRQNLSVWIQLQTPMETRRQ